MDNKEREDIEEEDDEKNLESKYESLEREIKNLRSKISKIVSENTNNKKYGNFLSSSSKNKNNNDGNNNVINATFRCRRKLEGHFGKIYSLHWAYNKNSASNYSDIVSASQDGKLLIWNTETTNKKLAINLKSSWVMTCCYSYNNQFIASGGLDSTCSIYDVEKIPEGGWHNDKPFRELCQHEGYLSSCKFIGDNQNNQIITSSGDGTCILWDVIKNKSIQQFNNNDKDNGGDIECLDINQNKSIFVCGSIDSVAKIFDYRMDGDDNKCIATFRGQHNGEDINCIKFFPDGQSFISGSDDNTLKLFDLKSYKLINTYFNSDIKSSCISCDFSNSGYYIISGYDDQDPFCVVWNTITGQNERELQHGSKVPAIQTSSNGFAVATGCWDRIIRIWA